MSGLPSALKRMTAGARILSRTRLRGNPFRRLARTAIATALACILSSCRTEGGSASRWNSGDSVKQGIYPPAPQSPRVVALGNLHAGAQPTPTEVKLSMFLFGTEPEPMLAFVRPTDVAFRPGQLIVSDGGLAALLTWDFAGQTLKHLGAARVAAHPASTTAAPNGDLLVTDPDAGMVHRVDPDGSERMRYKLTEGEYRPADAIQIGDAVWVANVASHAIEVFDANTGRHDRSIGRRGAGPLEFGMPMGMTCGPAGDVFVVDVLNSRVQQITADGRFVRSLGGPGDVAGRFGRPRDVAVGPDGTVFVTDGASQRVHAFNAEGRALLAFGDQADPIGGLSMPNGICVSTSGPSGRSLPDGFVAEYYVYVAEQLLRPGIRVYAWGRRPGDAARASSAAAASAHGPVSPAPNPHWSAARCGECHRMEDGRTVPIAIADVDVICLNCHDGHKARSEPHPVGRSAQTASVSTPKDWPTNAGLINCLTCHDIERHCAANATRPSINPAMLRHHNPERPLELCLKCHTATETWRISPHRQIDDRGAIKSETCAFCHAGEPQNAPNGTRRNSPQLHAQGSALCLTCHTRHWDVSPRGHVDRPVPPEFLKGMQGRQPPAGSSTATASVAAMLPLASGMVTCYTCHNPHAPGLFPAGSALGATATRAEDKAISLRTNSTDMCIACHDK